MIQLQSVYLAQSRLVDRGQTGHRGRTAQKHAVPEIDHEQGNSFGLMIEYSLKQKLKIVISVSKKVTINQ